MQRALDALEFILELSNSSFSAARDEAHVPSSAEWEWTQAIRRIFKRIRSAEIRILTGDELQRSVAELDALLDESKAASVRASRAAADAARSAGEQGTSELQSAFEKYAFEERRTAGRFRIATVVILSIVVLAAVALVVYGYVSPRQESGNFAWSETIYHVAFLSALSALSAYLARQATHHRQAAVWAEGITVQLRSFLAFVSPIDDAESKARVYEAFARRVLGSPPDSGKTDDDSSAQQLLAAVTEILSKRSS